jgi:hypothetical protein
MDNRTLPLLWRVLKMTAYQQRHIIILGCAIAAFVWAF